MREKACLFLVLLGIGPVAFAQVRDTRPPNDPSSIADEPKDPPADDPVFVEPEITLESVTVRPLSQSPHAKELGEKKVIVTLGQLQLISNASDLDQVKLWIRNLAYWIGEQSSCSKDIGTRVPNRARHCLLAEKRVRILSDRLPEFKALMAPVDEDARVRSRNVFFPDNTESRPAKNDTGSLNKVD
jgi:hypothetical protein